MARTRASLSLGIALLAVLLAACTGATPSAPAPTTTDARPTVSPLPASPAPSSATLPASLAAAIVADAAAALGVDPSAVVIVRAEATTWSDGSLGCPEAGVNYTQALVDGYKVFVAAADQELDYRTGNGGTFKRCDGFRPGG